MGAASSSKRLEQGSGLGNIERPLLERATINMKSDFCGHVTAAEPELRISLTAPRKPCADIYSHLTSIREQQTPGLLVYFRPYRELWVSQIFRVLHEGGPSDEPAIERVCPSGQLALENGYSC